MADWQKHPGNLYIDPSAPDGVYLVRKDGVRFTEFLRLVDGTGTAVNVDAGAGEVAIDTADVAQLYPLTSKPAGGDPGLVFGGPDDDELIYTEGPL